MKSVNLKGLTEQFHKDNEITFAPSMSYLFEDVVLENVYQIRSCGSTGLQIIFWDDETISIRDKDQSSLYELNELLSKEYKLLVIYIDDNGEIHIRDKDNIEKRHDWEITMFYKIKNLRLSKDKRKELAQIEHDILTTKKYLSKKELLNRLKNIFDESQIDSKKTFAKNCMYVEGWTIRGRNEFFPYRQGFMEMES